LCSEKLLKHTGSGLCCSTSLTALLFMTSIQLLGHSMGQLFPPASFIRQESYWGQVLPKLGQRCSHRC